MKNKMRNRFFVGVIMCSILAGSSGTVLAADTEIGTADSGSSGNQIAGGETIVQDGTYVIADNATGSITVEAENVTLTGSTDTVYENLSILCKNSGTQLTLSNVRISGDSAETDSVIEFTGTGNTLCLAGTNLIDNDGSDYSAIHVPADASLTVADLPDDEGTGVLYLYKNSQSAGIGGDSGEANGQITFESGRIFAKGTKQGAVIGTGSSATGTTGDITINGGELYLIANARGAAIGGGAGSSGGTSGGTVYMNNGTLTINVDWTGAAIGGGGYASGNDAKGGTLVVTGGSIRTYVDNNAYSYWGLDTYGVNDVAITAEKVNADGSEVILLTLDTTLFEDADDYSVQVDGSDVYSGGLHNYRYVNESPDSAAVSISDTTTNWISTENYELYLYVTPEDHVVTVNGENMNCVYNAADGTFSMEEWEEPDESGKEDGTETGTNTQTLNGVCKSEGVWAYYIDGKIQTSYTGFQKNANGWWYIKNGKVDFSAYSVIRDKDSKGKSTIDGTYGWWYVAGGRVQTGSYSYTGVANYKNANGWWYVKNGKVDFTANTVAKNKNGWWYVVGGKVQLTYTGVANYKNASGWWYVKNGKVDFTANTVAKNKNGWWYVKNGKVDFTANTVAKNANGWWYVYGGKVNMNFSGVAKNSKGWWYIKNGKVDFTYSGKITTASGTYSVIKGKVIR